MSRGPVSKNALKEAVARAARRGMVICIRPGRDSPCHFQVVSRQEITFVTVKQSRRFHLSAADMEAQYGEAVGRLRMIPAGPGVRKELWVSSRCGSWRIFSVTDTGMDEVLSPG